MVAFFDAVYVTKMRCYVARVDCHPSAEARLGGGYYTPDLDGAETLVPPSCSRFATLLPELQLGGIFYSTITVTSRTKVR